MLSVGLQGQRDQQGAADGGVADGVVQQVAHQLTQHPFVGAQRDGGVGLQLKVQQFVGNQRRQVQRHLAHDGIPGGQLAGLRLLAQLLHLGQ